ncbi:MAG: phosphoribosylformylglycinamidine synthase [Gammaproteobacteria bacterium]|nr:phosphoribosylformylglycinamidine synthase [Gammaproteobacteria bacterium]
MLYLRGQAVLSVSSKQKLLAEVQNSVPSVQDIHAEYAYFVALSQNLSDVQCGDLGKILHHEPPSSQAMLGNLHFIVMPHFSIITAWSKSVTELARDCGLTAVERIERGILYQITTETQINDDEAKRIAKFLYNEETQTLLPDIEFAKALFVETINQAKVRLNLAPATDNSQSNDMFDRVWTINGEKRAITMANMMLECFQKDGDVLLSEHNVGITRGKEASHFYPNNLTNIYEFHQEDQHTTCQLKQSDLSTLTPTFYPTAIGRGSKTNAVLSGYTLPDLNVPGYVHPWEQLDMCMDDQQTSLAIIMGVPSRQAQDYHKLGLPLVGGFLRTAPKVFPRLTSTYIGNIRSNHIKSLNKPGVQVKISADMLLTRQRLVEACCALSPNPVLSLVTYPDGDMIWTIAAEQLEIFEALCQRANCLYKVEENSGNIQTGIKDIEPAGIRVSDAVLAELNPWNSDGIKLEEAIKRVLQLPAVANKSFILNHSDRSVGGLVARDSLVGPWQVPVSNFTVSSNGFEGNSGVVVALGERTLLAEINSAASVRMAIAEAITNIAGAKVEKLSNVKLALSWSESAQPANAGLYEMAKTVALDFCPELKLSVLANDCQINQMASSNQQIAPSVVVTAIAPINNIRRVRLPRLKRHVGESYLILLDLGEGQQRMGGSCLAQVYQKPASVTPDSKPALLNNFFLAIQALLESKQILAYHDRSDGGLLVSLCEMAFASHIGIKVYLDGLGSDPIQALFNEELGAVIQIKSDEVDEVLGVFEALKVPAIIIGELNKADELEISLEDQVIYRQDRVKLQQWWSKTSYKIEALTGNPTLAKQEFEQIADPLHKGLSALLSFDPKEDVALAFANLGLKPKVAILRHASGHGHIEMAAAFHFAGFECVDITMQDLKEGKATLDNIRGLAICGGASYNDILGSGKGWAQTILLHSILRDIFTQFFNRPDTFTLGIGNGCQLLSYLKDIIPGSGLWPTFERNISEKFEARLSMVEITPSKSILMSGMAGSKLPIGIAHGFGRAKFVIDSTLDQLQASQQLTMRYIDHSGNPTDNYPYNPNGSLGGVTGFCSEDGRVTAMMPHPERVFRTTQMSWFPQEWGAYSPWMRLFRNARLWVG